ncbi:MAG: SemiSWEET transporter [Bosea sp. (in: a-proteobacteria)]
MSPAFIETLGFLAAACTTLCWVPQAVRTIRTKDTKAISLWMQILLIIGIGLWLVYGLLIMSWPLIASNVVTLVLVGIILGLKLRYG